MGVVVQEQVGWGTRLYMPGYPTQPKGVKSENRVKWSEHKRIDHLIPRLLFVEILTKTAVLGSDFKGLIISRLVKFIFHCIVFFSQ